jgi:hypothetical protein
MSRVDIIYGNFLVQYDCHQGQQQQQRSAACLLLVSSGGGGGRGCSVCEGGRLCVCASRRAAAA